MLDKVLISQFGAIKPPWIDNETFYKLPFNFCDRWCERCALAKICRVYQKEQFQKQQFITQGIDPLSIEAVLKSTEVTFSEIHRMIKKDLKRFKIKLTKKDLEEAGKEEETIHEKAVKDSLHLTCLKLTKHLSKFIDDLRYYFLDNIPSSINTELEILIYYLHFIGAKIYRALSGYYEEIGGNDEKSSAFLAYIAILKIISSLRNIAELNNTDEKLKRMASLLAKAFSDFNQILLLRFDINLEK